MNERVAAVLERVESAQGLDGPASQLADVTEGRDNAIVRAARGEPLGHPAHPPLTDLPIGFWTSAWVLDLVGLVRRRPSTRSAAQTLVGLGVATALPTAFTGLVDVPGLDVRRRRVAVVHALSNATATGLYMWSWRLRRRGRHGAGVAVGMVAAGAATAGGFLGGHLAFGE